MNKLYLLSHLHSNRFNSLAVQGMHACKLMQNVCPVLKEFYPPNVIPPLTILTLTCSYPTRENSFFT